MITCRELIDILSDYLTGALPADQRGAIDQHLALCPHCVAYLNTYRQTILLGKAAFAPDNEIPSDVPEDLIKAIVAAAELRRS